MSRQVGLLKPHKIQYVFVAPSHLTDPIQPSSGVDSLAVAQPGRFQSKFTVPCHFIHSGKGQGKDQHIPSCGGSWPIGHNGILMHTSHTEIF